MTCVCRSHSPFSPLFLCSFIYFFFSFQPPTSPSVPVLEKDRVKRSV